MHISPLYREVLEYNTTLKQKESMDDLNEESIEKRRVVLPKVDMVRYKEVGPANKNVDIGK